jgi:hypothetical protein
MTTIKKAKSGSKIPKAQGGRLLRKVADKIVSKESNRIVDKIVKRPLGMTDKPVDYGKVVLTDAQKARNAEILKNPGTATADSWARAKKIAKKESSAQSNAQYLERSNKPMLKPIGSPSAETLGKRAKNIKKSAPPKAKDGKWMQKAAASIKKRGTEGKCTPITKPGCTGKAKALAKTFKKIAAKRKGK